MRMMRVQPTDDALRREFRAGVGVRGVIARMRGRETRVTRFVVVVREEPLEKEQGQEAGGRPVERLRRPNPHRLRHHVKEGRAEHRARRKTQVDLEAGVVQHDRQRHHPPEQADDHDARAERGERDRDAHRQDPYPPRVLVPCG